ncbi:MAG TPA: DUF1844 domain-containing protein [Candidatus Omnitrophota bacterium]|nr:hypothetical protein [Candidatus Omnitrophota bacterium]HRK61666.1 DUF1844 domain-containing protein [Candidatus Omnitrophota bacterium]
MGFDKDIRFPEKKVDSGWKEQISRDKSVPVAPAPQQPGQAKAVPPSPEFMNFLKSLATQALMSLGEIPHPMTGQRELDPATAKEMIDLLSVLKLKTQGNCSPEENAIFTSLLPELQLKFSQQA